MRINIKKTGRTLKFRTQQSQNDRSQQENIKKSSQCLKKRQNSVISINKMPTKQLFQQQNSNIAIQPITLKKRIPNLLLHSKSDININQTSQSITTTRILITRRQKKPNKQIKMMKSLFKKNKMFTIIKDQILRSQKLMIQIFELLSNILNILERLISQVYSYYKIEQLLKKLNNVIKDTMSRSLVFQCYTLCGLSLFIYGSYSLCIFYFDKALKRLSQIQPNNITYQNRIKQIQIYKTVAQIFLVQGEYKLAKQFAYKYLRKAWYSKSLQQQLSAYDILGKIYHECEIKNMSLYFHNRMCKGEKEEIQFTKLSNFQLEKYQKEKIQFAVYQTIHIFVQRDKLFHQMLEDRYKMRDHNYQDKQVQNLKSNFFFHTHRSPNRNLNSYRKVQRRMIEDKNSKQLHFIKPQQAPSIKKLFMQFIKIINKIKQQIEEQNQNIKISTNYIEDIKSRKRT